MPGEPLGRRAMSRGFTLRARLGLGAALLGAGTLLTAAILWFGMTAVSERLEKALASEGRVDTYAALSSQAATFLVVATEAVQSGLSAEDRMVRLDGVEARMTSTFEALNQGVAMAVADAQDLGLDAQSRLGTQSLGIARMQALFDRTMRGLSDSTRHKDSLRAEIDSFSTGFDPLLSQAVNTELRFRRSVLAGIETLRMRLRTSAVVIAGLTFIAVAIFYFALIRPQFRRLDVLRQAATRIGSEDFDVMLPEDRADEIGQLYGETNRMAQALAARKTAVQSEWARLNETIEHRTQALSSANATLAQIDANRRRFFADISHELRTPLTVILMEAQIGAAGTEDPKLAFSTIENRAARLNRRIDDLLRVARSDSGQLALEFAQVSVAELFKQVRLEVQSEIENAAMILTVEAPEGLRAAWDPNWIRQVLVGLIRNAIRHARDGTQVALTACVEDEGHLSLQVTDNGPGIDPADCERIFERFEQGSLEGAERGYGLGLALARWVIEEHKGQIAAISPVPADEALGAAPGTQISIRLPCVAR